MRSNSLPPTPPHKETIQLYNRGWEVMDRKRNWAICTLESKHTHVIHTHTGFFYSGRQDLVYTFKRKALVPTNSPKMAFFFFC